MKPLLIEAVAIIALYTGVYFGLLKDNVKPVMAVFLMSIPLAAYIIERVVGVTEPIARVEKEMEDEGI